jgi:hypothetical protein
VNHLDPRPRQRDFLADSHLTKKRRNGTGSTAFVDHAPLADF